MEALRAVPARPNNPTLPAAYAGPKIKAAGAVGDAVINTFV
jgi:hypothetical protein